MRQSTTSDPARVRDRDPIGDTPARRASASISRFGRVVEGRDRRAREDQRRLRSASVGEGPGRFRGDGGENVSVDGARH